MTTRFEIIPAEFSFNPELKPYYLLAEGFGLYLEGEYDVQALGIEVTRYGIGRQYLPLDDLSLHPLKALKILGCSNTEALAKATRYECGFSNKELRHCFVPVGIETSLPGLAKYGEVYDQHGHDYHGALLHVSPEALRFDPTAFNWVGLLSEDGDKADYERGLRRFEHLYLGSGQTLAMLSARSHRATVRPVQLRLSNGDKLIGFAFAVRPRAQATQPLAA